MASLFLSYLLSATLLSLPADKTVRPPLSFYPDWTSGFVVLETGDTLSAPLRFNPVVREGLLQVETDNRVLTLSVKDVKAFFFYDDEKGRDRHFLTLNLSLPGAEPNEMFIEYVYENERAVILNHRTWDKRGGLLKGLRQPHARNAFYLLERSTGQLLPLSYEHLSEVVANRQRVDEFIDINGLRFRRVSEYVRVLEYDQSLTKKIPASARY